MYAVKCLAEVDEADCKWGLVLSTFFSDTSENEDLFSTSVFWSEACLFISQLAINDVS